ncbi:MAG: glutamine-hydrolyzing carbamoyl-phosphate synthase small subunit [Polyangia bacterium]|jgi:carbamoyl-phosphate synthase small subunit|nr:glutamine-hydrolyzing carbamoyl-phosphate synthase small subunit [Polyangia bacterium]
MEANWKLVLEDGSVFPGRLFGVSRPVTGEVVFNTGMTGYVEALSDPSYKGQILVLTYPLVGNYGVPGALLQTGLPHPFESTTIQVLGLVVARYEPAYSHHAAVQSLGEWLGQCGVPAVQGVDTRGLTRRLRERGTMRGKLCPAGEGDDLGADTLDMDRLVPLVSRPGVDRYIAREGAKTLLLIDCGAKHNILRSLLGRGVNVVRAPWDHDFVTDDLGADGLFLSNGPGDPEKLTLLVERLRTWMERGRPTFGICLGHQLLALAAGGRTYRLPYGHRSQNQPVEDLLTGRGYITSQNHGYGVDARRLPKGFIEWFVNANDGTNEGIRHIGRPCMSVQFHPEAYPGPVETGALFDEFVQVLCDA